LKSANDAYPRNNIHEFEPTMEMHAIEIEEIMDVIVAGGGRLIEIENCKSNEYENSWTRYFVTKK